MSDVPDLSKYTNSAAESIDLARMEALGKGYTLNHNQEHHSVVSLIRAAACTLDTVASQLEEMNTDIPHPFWPDDLPFKQTGSELGDLERGAVYLLSGMDLMVAQTMEGLSDNA